MTEQRKYALTRLSAGDYIFPSNGGTRLWRVYTYEEDGSLYRGERQVKGTFWAAARFEGTVAQAERLFAADPDEFLSWSMWEFWAGPLRSRAEAIAEALRAATEKEVLA